MRSKVAQHRLLKETHVATAPKAPRQTRAEAREKARNEIIDIATREFVDKGLAGARIDEIAGNSDAGVINANRNSGSSRTNNG